MASRFRAPAPRPHLRLLGALAACGALLSCGGLTDTDGRGAMGEAGVGAVDSALVVCPRGPTVEGIDVSYYQGTIDWDQVKASGRAFAITRVGDGYFEDPVFETNWAAIKRVGMVRGVYQFFRPGKDPEAQADILIRKVGKLGPGDLPAVIDVEATDGQPPDVVADRVRRWVARVAAGTGRPPMVYTGKYFWNDNVKTGDLAGNPLWIAAWGPPCPDTPQAWSGWRMWQYSSKGVVPGIRGDVDLDKFNGSQAELLAFAGAVDWAARYVSQSWPLATSAMTLRAGEVVDAAIELRNTGAATWDGRTRLGTTEPRDRASPFYDPQSWLSANRAAAVSGTVAPGGTFRFAFRFRAPQQPGSYHEHFTLLQEGVAWFSDAGQGGPPDRQIEAWIEVTPAPEPPPPDLAGPGDEPAPDLGGAGAPPELQGGCACSAAGPGRSGRADLLLAALALLFVRRRRPLSPALPRG